MNDPTLMQFLPIVLIIVVFYLCVRFFGRRRRNAVPQPIGPHPSGFQGWLALLALSETFMPVRWAANAVELLQGDEVVAPLSGANPALIADSLLFGAMAVFSAVVMVLMWRRHHRFRILYTVQWGLALAVSLTSPWLLAAIMGEGMSFTAAYAGDNATPLLQSAVGGLWVAYVWRSIRVRNTFVVGRRDVGDPLVDPAIFS